MPIVDEIKEDLFAGVISCCKNVQYWITDKLLCFHDYYLFLLVSTFTHISLAFIFLVLAEQLSHSGFELRL